MPVSKPYDQRRAHRITRQGQRGIDTPVQLLAALIAGSAHHRRLATEHLGPLTVAAVMAVESEDAA